MPVDEQIQKGHPKGLYVLFFTEMWERFSYYGMRALLVLYLTAELFNGGFGLLRENALGIYAIFTGLVYLTPIVGGILADKILGQRKAIFIGAITMAMGQFSLAASVIADSPDMRMNLLYYGLAILIIGNGFFKPNISTMVGGLYKDGDPRKDSAFTIFYMGINLGAFFSPLVCGTLGEVYGWEYGFGTAGLGMLLGMFWFVAQGKALGEVGYAPKNTDEVKGYSTKDWMDVLYYVVGSAVLCFLFVYLWFGIDETIQQVIIYSLLAIGLAGLIYVIVSGTNGPTEWSRVGVILVLALFHVVFWSGFEQAGGTFNLFAAENTDRILFDWEIPATYFQSINAIAIFAIAPIFSLLWVSLDKIGKNPRTTVKFAIALILLSLGFFVMAEAKNSAADGLVSPLWLVGVYLLHTLGELAISPIGLSMITKLSPTKIVSAMMGVWMGSIALGNFLAGIMESVLESFGMELFSFIALEGLVAAGLLILLSPFLNKMMKGIH